MRYNISVFYTTILLIVLSSCSKIDGHSPVSMDGEAPEPVKNVRVENLPGAAKIMYSLPQNPDLLYVEAQYEIRNGVSREIKSTYYNSSLIVDGFGTSAPYEIKLYTVGRSGKRSAPISVQVEPLKPPVAEVRESLHAVEDFGGMNLTFSNSTGAELAIVVVAADSITGEWKEAQTNYTSAKDGDFSVRGFPPVKTRFGVFVRDRWANYSDTLWTDLTPIYETMLDKSRFQEVFLPGDFAATYFGSRLAYIWDDDYDENVYYAVSHSTTDPADFSGPHHYTFDLGVTSKLSRFRLWQVPLQYLYGHNNVKRMEVWTSTDPPADGSWDGWTKALEIEIVKPSGLPYGQNSNEDIAVAAAGHEFIFPRDLAPARYIRFRNLENWSGNYAFQIAEVTFWGTE